MDSLLNALRSVLGSPDFYIENSGYSSTWDYGAMLEYMIAGVILCVVISSVFKFIRCLIK